MKITFYGYNAFVVENGSRKIAIDPGALFLHYFRLTPLIPKKEWAGITHIFVTHGDPDHYWHADRVAAAAQAPLICNTTMLRTISGRELMLGPRTKGLSFTWPAKQVHTISADQTIEMDGMKITGVETAHGPLVIKIGPISNCKCGVQVWGQISTLDICSVFLIQLLNIVQRPLYFYSPSTKLHIQKI